MEVHTLHMLKGLLAEVRLLEKKIRVLLKSSDFIDSRKSTNSVEKKEVSPEKPNIKIDAEKKINQKPEKRRSRKKRWRKKKIHNNVPSPKVDSPKILKEIVPSPNKVPNWPTIKLKEEEKELNLNPVPIPKNDEKMKQQKEESNKILTEKHREDGNRFYKLKDYQSAHLSYQNAFVLSPNDARNLGNLVNCFVAKGEFEEAIQLSIEILSNETLDERNEKVLSGIVKQTLKCAEKLNRDDLIMSYLDVAQGIVSEKDFETLQKKYKPRLHAKSRKRK